MRNSSTTGLGLGLWLLAAPFVPGCRPERPATPPAAVAKSPRTVAADPVAPSVETVGTDEWKRKLSVAAFAGETLASCSTVSVSLDKQNAGNYDADSFVGGFLAAMAGDHVTAMKGREASLQETDGSVLDGISRFVSMKEDELREATRDKKNVAGIAEARKMLKTFLSTRWPTQDVEVAIKKGTLATVPDCAFPDRTALGSCSIRRGREGLRVFIVANHYAAGDVIDSDRALKMCLRFGGAWQGVAKRPGKREALPPQAAAVP
ncbi:MAG: hypothetical protein SF187_29695 [Deltaproteobacteria bacterium]|nr:hypothetical protein [Deltaproteobacteria bacterium]